MAEAGVLDTLLSLGRCANLLLIGQRERCIGRRGTEIDLCSELLLHAGVPVMVIPGHGNFAKVGSRVLVAWKDSREAMRALRDALPILRAAEHVELFHLCAASGRAAAEERLASTRAWIRRAGVASRAHLEVGDGDDATRLLDRVSEIGADLLVMGGYGHSRAREAVLGGATRHVLRHMTRPTLLSH